MLTGRIFVIDLCFVATNSFAKRVCLLFVT